MSARTERDALKSVYEGLEAAFSDQASEDAYRAAMLARSAEQGDFLSARLDHASVLEAGCGNGRLLIELARRGSLREGLGIDLASSRIQFARRWVQQERLEELRFEVADVLELLLPTAAYDAIICITGAFAYFEPVRTSSGAAVLRDWATALRPSGLLVLELYPHPEIVRLLEVDPGPLRLWQELGPEDPWRFYLSELRIENGILVHDKTFIHRATGEVDAGRRERLMLYSEQQIRELLIGAGLTEVACREGWSDRPYAQGEVMVVTARTQS